MGVTDCDNMLMLLGVSNKMSEKERDVVVPMMMRGFKVGNVIFIVQVSMSVQIMVFVSSFICVHLDIWQ